MDKLYFVKTTHEFDWNDIVFVEEVSEVAPGFTRASELIKPGTYGNYGDKSYGGCLWAPKGHNCDYELHEYVKDLYMRDSDLPELLSNLEIQNGEFYILSNFEISVGDTFVL